MLGFGAMTEQAPLNASGSTTSYDTPTKTGDPEAPLPVQLLFEKVSIEVNIGQGKTKRILDEVSGIFGPRECIAVMGPSGSGKTTMLNALTGVTKPTSGTITVNGQPFDQGAMRRVAAFVPQDDLLTPNLTVDEALMEAALFKMGAPSPDSPGTSDQRAKVDALLSQFDLEGCRDVLIGHPEGRKGISGGQKRRLSVALELCGSPSLLYLDEPTSGLDAVSTMTLVQLMASLARRGVTVIATIHQPSAAAFFTFDRLLLLHQGQICYQGPVSLGAQPVAFFSAAGFPCPPLDNPADFMFGVLVKNAAEVRKLYESEGVPEDKTRAADSSLPALTSSSGDGYYSSSFLTQLKTHIARDFKTLIRDPMLAKLRVGAAVLMGLAMGILYWQIPLNDSGTEQYLSLLLFSMLFLAIVNVLPVVLAILPELAVVTKEVRNNWYSPWAYTPAKLVVETPLLVIPPLLYVLIMGFMTQLVDDGATRFFTLYLAILMVVLAAHAWALLICSVSSSTDIAVLLAPGSILPMAVLSGFFVNQQDMSWIFRWFTYIDFLNYGWQAMAIAGFQGKVFVTSSTPSGTITGAEIIETRLRLPSSPDLGGYWMNIGIVIAFIVVFRIGAIAAVSHRLAIK